MYNLLGSVQFSTTSLHALRTRKGLTGIHSLCRMCICFKNTAQFGVAYETKQVKSNLTQLDLFLAMLSAKSKIYNNFRYPRQQDPGSQQFLSTQFDYNRPISIANQKRLRNYRVVTHVITASSKP